MKNQNIYTILSNLVLLTAFIFVHDKSFIFCLGAFLFFVLGYLIPSDIKPKKVINIFILASLPFLIIAFTYTIAQYHHWQFNSETLKNVLPIFLYYLLPFIISLLIGLFVQRKVKTPENKRLIFISLITFFVGIMSGIINWSAQFSIVGAAYATGGYIIGSDVFKKNIKSILILIAPFILIYTLLSIIYGSKQTYPICLIAPIGALTGTGIKLLYIHKRKIIFAFFSFFLVILLIAGYFGMKNWLEYVFSERENSNNIIEMKFDFQKENSGSVTENDIQGKITVFYFWSTSCSVCFKKFPELEKLCQKYSDKEDIMIYSVNINVSRNDLNINMYEKIRNLGYTFPVLVVPLNEKDICLNNFWINAFPHSTIINKKGKIIHNGRFNNDPTVLINNIDKILTKLISD